MPASGHGNRQGEHGSQQHIQQRKPAGASKRCEHYPRRRLRYQAHTAVACDYRSLWCWDQPDSSAPTSGQHARADQRNLRGAWRQRKPPAGPPASGKRSRVAWRKRELARRLPIRYRTPARYRPRPPARSASQEFIAPLHRLVLRTTAIACH